MSMNKRHLRDEIAGLAMVGPLEGLDNPLRFIATVSEIVHREGIPAHFADDLDRIKNENYLREQARINANMKLGDRYGSHELAPFIVQEHGFLRINYCGAILAGVKQWAESDDSFRLMKHHDILQESFEEAFTAAGARWESWIDEFEVLWRDEILPGYPQFKEKLIKLYRNAQDLFKKSKSSLSAKGRETLKANGVDLLGDIYKFFYRFCLGITPHVENHAEENVEVPGREGAAKGRPPTIQVIQDNICDGKKMPIIPKKARKR